MKIAILGTRGIPNHYGGFEQYAELLSVYLADAGWEVLVYNSSDHPYKETSYKGVQIKHVYDPERKWGTVGQFLYDLGCIWHTRKQGFDMVYQLGYTSSAVFNFLFPHRTIIVTNMDGMEWKRTKYNRWVQRFLKFSEWLVVRKSDHLVADSLGIQAYLQKKYKAEAFYSAYTATVPQAYDEKALEHFGLMRGAYDLLIARMEPENNIEMIIEGHLKSPSDKPLVIVGGIHAPYGQFLFRKYNSLQIQFRGAIYEKDMLDNLRRFARLYFHGHSVGGTNPSLLEAMACGCRIVAHDNQFNRGVLETEALYFQNPDELKTAMDKALDNVVFFESAIVKNIARITNLYNEAAVFSRLKDKLTAWKGGEK
jgi:glycosyltransferase involved in cell wall biosynthesis